MAKPLRTKEILNYLLKERTPGEPLYSQRQISRTLGVSQTTIFRINKALNNYLASGREKEVLLSKNDFELNKILFPNKMTPKLTDNDLKLLLDYLKKPEQNANRLLKELQEGKISNIGISGDGEKYLKSCNYQTFNLSLHNFCTKMGYSDRFIFKPAEYLEIGVLPFRQKAKAKEQSGKTLKEMGRFLFYIYFPFSRKASILLIDANKPEFTNTMITGLILFFQANGLPLAIVGTGRIEEVFKDADLSLLKDYFNFCGLLYSSDKRHCVFKEKETELIETINASLNTNRKTNPVISKNLQERIEIVCSSHNAKCEKEESAGNLPKGNFIQDLGIGQRQANCHVKFKGHSYSSKYTHKTVRIALEFRDGNVYFITKPLTTQKEQEILSSHLLYIKKEEDENKEKKQYEKKYSTNENDLPPNDEEARKYGLWTEDDLLSWIIKKYNIKSVVQEEKKIPNPDNPIIKVVTEYINSKKNKMFGLYPQQAFNLLAYMCRVPENRVVYIKEGCNRICETKKDKNHSWNKMLADLLYHNIMPDKPRKDEQEEDVDISF